MRLLIILLLICPSAFAAFTTMTIEGVKEANGVWSTAGVMDTQGFVRTTGAVSVYGTTRNLPMVMQADTALMSRSLKLATKLAGPLAVAATAYDVYQWATSTDITSSGDTWAVRPEGASDPGFTYGAEWYATIAGQVHVAASPLTICKAHNTWLKSQNMYGWSTNIRLTPATNSYTCDSLSSTGSFIVGSLSIRSRACTSDKVLSCTPPTSVSDDFFLRLPDPSIPVLSSGWSKLPSLAGQPTPIKGVSFQPYSEWMGDPYFKDGNWYRDRMDISPSGTKSSPTRVRADIGPVKIEGATDPNTVPDTNSGGGGAAQPKEKPSFCEANPGSIACAEMGELKQEPFDPVEKPFNITPQSPWGSGDAQCPAPKVMHLTTGSTVTLSYQPACDFFRGVRPAVLALALLSALYIALGIPVGKGD